MNPKDKIKQLLGEAIVETDSSLDQRILADAWQAGRGCRKMRQGVVGLVATITIFVVVLLCVRSGPNSPKDSQAYVNIPIAERLTLGAINATYRDQGLDGLDLFFELAGNPSGQRPERLSIQSVLEDFED